MGAALCFPHEAMCLEVHQGSLYLNLVQFVGPFSNTAPSHFSPDMQAVFDDVRDEEYNENEGS